MCQRCPRPAREIQLRVALTDRLEAHGDASIPRLDRTQRRVEHSHDPGVAIAVGRRLDKANIQRTGVGALSGFTTVVLAGDPPASGRRAKRARSPASSLMWGASPIPARPSLVRRRPARWLVGSSMPRCHTGARHGSQRVLSLPGCAAALIALPILPPSARGTGPAALAAPAQAAIPSYELAAHVLTASRFSRPLGAG